MTEQNLTRPSPPGMVTAHEPCRSPRRRAFPRTPFKTPAQRVARGLLGLATWVYAGVAVRPVRVWVAGTACLAAGLVPAGWFAWASGGLAGVVAATAGSATILTRSGHRSPLILSDLSSLVRRLKLAKRTRRRWRRTMLDAGLSRAADGATNGRRIPRHRRIRLTPTGVTTRVYLAAVGASGDDLRAKAAVLKSHFHVSDIRVKDLRPGWVRLDLRLDPPFRTPVRLADVPKPTQRNHVTVGIDIDGQGVEVDLRLPRLIVGAQGAGKSNETWALLDGLQRAGIPYRLRAFDPKGGMELGCLAKAAYQYEDNPLAWPKFLGNTLGALQARQRDMARRGSHKLKRYTWADPLDLLLVDELVSVLTLRRGDVKLGTATLKTDEAFLLLLSQGRAAGFNVIGCTQLPDKDVIGPVRSLFSYASCLRLGALESASVDVVLGRGAASSYPAHKLPAGKATAGIGWCASPSGEVIQYRGALVSDVDRARVARQLARDTARVRAARQVPMNIEETA